MKKLLTILAFLLISNSVWASFVYVPMSHNNQKNHLKAYGIVFFSLQQGNKAKWLLNYDGGAFLIENNTIIEKECKIRGVSYQIISDAKAQLILQEIASPSQNMEAVTLEKAPKI
ncbi:MAG: asparagine synthetase B, partial [Tenacibaculum sp.]